MKYILLFFGFTCFSQKYYLDNNNIHALKVYEVYREEQADVFVFFVKNKEQANNKGCWFIGKRTLTSKPIRYVDFPQLADLKIYQVKIKELAGYKKGAN